MISTVLGRLRGARPDDAGVSLMEMLVAMIMMGLLGVAMTSTMSSIARGDTVTTSRERATQQAQVVLDRLTRDIRAAAAPVGGSTAVGYAADNHLTIFDDFTDGHGPRRIDITTTGGPTGATLSESTTLADAIGAFTGTAQTQIDSTDVAISPGALFTYYGPDSTTPLSTPMSTAATLAAITSIQIALVEREPGLSTPVTVSTRIYLRNVQYH